MRRAISCVYCAPKSRMTMEWGCTDECLRFDTECKGKGGILVSYVSGGRSGTSLSIGSPKSIVFWTAEIRQLPGGMGAGEAGAGNTRGISRIETYHAKRALQPQSPHT